MFHLKTFILLILCSRIVQAAQMDIIPINLGTKVPITTAQIENQTVRISFDSGALIPIILKKEVLDRARGVHYTGKMQESRNAAGKKYSNHQFKLRQIKLNTYATNNIVGNLYSPWGIVFKVKGEASYTEQQKESDLDGVFGLDIFKNKRFVFDYPGEKLVVLHREYFPEPYKSMKWTTCSRTMTKNGIVIDALYLGKKGRFLLDTGATASFLKPSFLSGESKDISVRGSFQVNSKTSPSQLTFLLYEFVLPSVDGVLGYNFFETRRIYINNKPSNQERDACLISRTS